jgi:predicted AAA+ superfamily ATPase
LLEDPDELARAREDPRGFLESLRTPAILDEIQNIPELLRYVRTRIDAAPRRAGRYLLSGSQEAPLMRGVTESMAGRVAIFQLLPFSMQEHPDVSLLRGGFPEVLARPAQAQTWFRSYVQTYLERDVRAVTAVRDLATFRRFSSLLATRHGQVLNRSELAALLGVSVPTLSQWLSVLEITGQILLLPPFFENLGKRLIKSPKLYFLDSGLACHLLGIDSLRALRARRRVMRRSRGSSFRRSCRRPMSGCAKVPVRCHSGSCGARLSGSTSTRGRSGLAPRAFKSAAASAPR